MVDPRHGQSTIFLSHANCRLSRVGRHPIEPLGFVALVILNGIEDRAPYPRKEPLAIDGRCAPTLQHTYIAEAIGDHCKTGHRALQNDRQRPCLDPWDGADPGGGNRMAVCNQPAIEDSHEPSASPTGELTRAIEQGAVNVPRDKALINVVLVPEVPADELLLERLGDGHPDHCNPPLGKQLGRSCTESLTKVLAILWRLSPSSRGHGNGTLMPVQQGPFLLQAQLASVI